MHSSGTVLTFRFEIDQTYLEKIIQQLEAADSVLKNISLMQESGSNIS